MMPLLFALELDAAAVLRTVEICVEFDLSFDDAETGDHWNDNAVNRKGRGVYVDVVDDLQTQHLRASRTSGCLTADVSVTAPAELFTVKILNHARIGAIDLDTYDTPNFVDQPEITETWSGLVASDGEFLFELPAEQHWENLAIGTWVFHRSSFHLQQPTDRACCLEADPAYLPDGTCSATPQPGNAYEVLDRPVKFFAHPNLTCGASTLDDEVAVSTNDPCNKFPTSHELGHVIAEMRMGDKETGQYDATASAEDCTADYNGATPMPYTSRGVMQKEFMGVAFREGWGDFVADWAWNDRTESDCVYTNQNKFMDFDLDGDLDNDFPSGSPYHDREIDCIGTPFLGPDPPSPPMNGTDWLEDLEAADDSADGWQCLADPTDEHNRSTIYDVAKLFWYLTSQAPTPLPPEDLADLYVDLCPRGWAQTDARSDDDELPYNRLIFSAAQHGIVGPVSSAGSAYIHH